MTKNTFLFLSVIVVLAYACGENKKIDTRKTELDKLKTEVISGHDSAMAKMNKVMMLERKLKALKVGNKDSLTVLKIDQALSELNSGHDNMMHWMHDFSTNFPKGTLMGEDHAHQHGTDAGLDEQSTHVQKNKEAIHAALEDELSKIQKISDNINQAISKADSLLIN